MENIENIILDRVDESELSDHQKLSVELARKIKLLTERVEKLELKK